MSTASRLYLHWWRLNTNATCTAQTSTGSKQHSSCYTHSYPMSTTSIHDYTDLSCCYWATGHLVSELKSVNKGKAYIRTSQDRYHFQNSSRVQTAPEHKHHLSTNSLKKHQCMALCFSREAPHFESAKQTNNKQNVFLERIKTPMHVHMAHKCIQREGNGS